VTVRPTGSGATSAPTTAGRRGLRVLQVTLRDLVGQRFNGMQLHRSLLERGHDSHMLVVHRHSDDPRVHSHGPAGPLLERGLYAAERVTGLQGLLSPVALGFPLRRCFREADLVHWHLVYPHYVGLPWMPFLAHRRPTVWTLHDPWALTGHCVHPLDCERWRTGCGDCPDLQRSFTVWPDTTAMVWRAKRRAYHRSPLTLVVASRWMKERVEASPLTSHLPCHVIPFGLDLGTWRPRARGACRERLSIPLDARVIAFRVASGAKHRLAKGIPWLIEALRRLPDGTATDLLVFQDRGQLGELAGRYRIHELGWIGDESRMADALSAADAFVMPSLAESFGMMALESMACGTPVVTTAGTATAELVRSCEAGLCVPPRDANALAAALHELMSNSTRRAAMSAAGRRIVETEYSAAAYVNRHMELYRELVEDAQPPRTVTG
jgi:glycosyltransferase involved in cell wall biosynthesis